MNKVLCIVDSALSADKLILHWRVHDERARTEMLDDLEAERDKPLLFFAYSIVARVAWLSASVAASPLA